MSDSPWDRRIARAAELEEAWPAAAELMRLYRQMAELAARADLQAARRAERTESHEVEPILQLLARAAPPPMAQAAEALLREPTRRQAVIESPSTPAEEFISLAVRQPYQEALARHQEALARRGTNTGSGPRTSVQPLCPFCGSRPVTAILRPEGDGAKRSLLCSLCFTEWDFRRLLCPHCGEEDKDKLPVYTVEEFPHIRVEACDACRSYIKSVDLTRNGLAVPEVDEIASISLDLWAAENGYSKLQTNLFGM